MGQLNCFYYYDRVEAVNDLSQRILELLIIGTQALQGIHRGQYVGGGLDSSAVAAIASRLAATERPDYPVTHSFVLV